MQGMVLSARFPGINIIDKKTALTPLPFWRKERDDREENMVTLMRESENAVREKAVPWERERLERGATLHSSDGEGLWRRGQTDRHLDDEKKPAK